MFRKWSTFGPFGQLWLTKSSRHLMVQNHNLKLMSTAVAEQKFEVSTLRTIENNPVNHDMSHLGRFYTIDPREFKRLFGKSGLYKGYVENCETFGEYPILIRKPFLDIKSCIEAYNKDYPTMRYVLYGKHGSGKSMTMAHLAHYGLSKEYILFHIPWGKLWSRYSREYVPSLTRPGYVDHTENSVIWLSYFRNQNSELIKKLDIQCEFDHEWTTHEKTPKGSSLLDIIEHGISRPPHAAECIYAIILELKQLSTNGKCKTMVLLSAVNAFYDIHWKIHRVNNTKDHVPVDKITVFEAFKEFLKSDWKGGVVVCTVDMRSSNPMLENDNPRALLKRKGWEDFDPFIPVHIPHYTPQEVQSTLDYYIDRNWLQHPDARTKEGRMELEYLSFRNPLQLMKICNAK